MSVLLAFSQYRKWVAGTAIALLIGGSCWIGALHLRNEEQRTRESAARAHLHTIGLAVLAYHHRFKSLPQTGRDSQPWYLPIVNFFAEAIPEVIPPKQLPLPPYKPDEPPTSNANKLAIRSHRIVVGRQEQGVRVLYVPVSGRAGAWNLLASGDYVIGKGPDRFLLVEWRLSETEDEDSGLTEKIDPQLLRENAKKYGLRSVNAFTAEGTVFCLYEENAFGEGSPLTVWRSEEFLNSRRSESDK